MRKDYNVKQNSVYLRYYLYLVCICFSFAQFFSYHHVRTNKIRLDLNLPNTNQTTVKFPTIYSRNLSNFVLARHSCPSKRTPELSKKIIITNTLQQQDPAVPASRLRHSRHCHRVYRRSLRILFVSLIISDRQSIPCASRFSRLHSRPSTPCPLQKRPNVALYRHF